MARPSEGGVRPEELARRISEIDLTNLRRRADTLAEQSPKYTQQESHELEGE